MVIINPLSTYKARSLINHSFSKTDAKAVGNGEAVLKYLAPYVYRVALSDRNILNVKDGKVTFKVKDRENDKFKTCTINVLEFLRRFLQYVLPKGLQ